MITRIVLALLAWSSAMAWAELDTIRIGMVRRDHAEGCFSRGELDPNAAGLYVEHLEGRFSSPIELCFSKDGAWASELELDLVWGSRLELEIFQADYRPFLTPRRVDGFGRVPIIVFATKSAGATEVQDIQGKSLAVNSRNPMPLNVEMPLAVLSNFGVPSDEIVLVEGDGPQDVIEAVRGGRADFGALEVASWGRTCNVYMPDQQGCDDMQIITLSRPRAESGAIIRNDATKEFQYRMVGVHTHMHLEAPEAHRWVVGGEAPELEPTEAEAFQVGMLDQQ